MTTAPFVRAFDPAAGPQVAAISTSSLNQSFLTNGHIETAANVFTQLPNLPGDNATCVTSSCAGTQTSSNSKRSGKGNSVCDKDKAHTTTNYCNTMVWDRTLLLETRVLFANNACQPYRETGGTQQTIQLFVFTGCKSGNLQPAQYQPPVYTYPGVAAKPFATTIQD